jgi:hypothetical protein
MSWYVSISPASLKQVESDLNAAPVNAPDEMSEEREALLAAARRAACDMIQSEALGTDGSFGVVISGRDAGEGGPAQLYVSISRFPPEP